MAKFFSYLARRFYQHSHSGMPILSFVASSDDIVKWAGVPRKAYEFRDGTLIGFQRQSDEKRVKEIGNFISSEKNVSPTAIVVAFREDAIRFQSIENNESLAGTNDPGEIGLIKFELKENPSSLSEAIEQYLALVRPRLPSEGEHELDNASAIESKNGIYEVKEDNDEFIIHDSHLVRFIRSLQVVLNDIDKRGDDPDLYSEEEQKLLETLTELLKPAMLVDGQHRVHGAHTLEADVAFTVCALSDASWEEQVFQFVVVNQKAQPIAAEFLGAIVSTSLTQSEIETLMERLDAAGINVEEYQMMDLVNNDPASPFRKMIKFRVTGEMGKLPYPGMRQLANQFRQLTPNPRFELLASHFCSGNSMKEKRREWEKDKWLEYFCAFWGIIKDKYGDSQSDENFLWEPESQLMRIAVLQIIQDEFLDWTLQSKRQWSDEVAEFKKLVQTWIEYVPREFFLEKWRGVKSIPSPDGRERIREALRKRISDPNFRFRKSRLFQENR